MFYRWQLRLDVIQNPVDVPGDYGIEPECLCHLLPAVVKESERGWEYCAFEDISSFCDVHVFLFEPVGEFPRVGFHKGLIVYL